MNKKRIYIADDHQIIIDGLKGLIIGLDEFSLCGEANDIEKAASDLASLKPDLAIIDIRMPNSTEGLKLLQWAVKNKISTRIVMLSMHQDLRLLQDAKNWGAKGYLLKNTGKEELFYALRHIAEGGTYFFEIPANDLQTEIVFTPKELEIIKLVIAGCSSSDISHKLGISDETVKVHRRNIRNKTGASNMAELLIRLNEIGYTF